MGSMSCATKHCRVTIEPSRWALGGSKTFMFGKLPIRIGAEVQYYVHQPDDFGPEWNFRFFFIPVVPAPEWASKPLFGS